MMPHVASGRWLQMKKIANNVPTFNCLICQTICNYRFLLETQLMDRENKQVSPKPLATFYH
jgi:hypothetical protein